MTKKKIILIILLVIILLLPIPTPALDEGGTRIYYALTYKIVAWNRVYTVYGEDGNISHLEKYDKVSVYFFPTNFKNYEQLWEIEQSK
ncbi:MAG: hypothetical protein J6C89_00940 [Clostridia bacterium]|nr:hypothetical protein [Clostridia bacterium]